MKLVNLTPHAINIADAEGNIIRTIPPTSPPARATSRPVAKGEIDGIPFVETLFGEVENLPDPQPDTYLIVSLVVIAAAAPERDDLVRPDTGPTCVRDGEGKIIAVRALTR